MKYTIVLAFVMSFCTGIFYAQPATSSIQVGDVFKIGEAHNNQYKYIHFPKANFIIKKGGIANFKNLAGKQVEVIGLDEQKDGSLMATIILSSNRKFFNSYRSVTVTIDKAIKEKELVPL